MRSLRTIRLHDLRMMLDLAERGCMRANYQSRTAIEARDEIAYLESVTDETYVVATRDLWLSHWLGYRYWAITGPLHRMQRCGPPHTGRVETTGYDGSNTPARWSTSESTEVAREDAWFPTHVGMNRMSDETRADRRDTEMEQRSQIMKVRIFCTEWGPLRSKDSEPHRDN